MNDITIVQSATVKTIIMLIQMAGSTGPSPRKIRQPMLFTKVSNPAEVPSDIGYVNSTANSKKSGFVHPKKKPAPMMLTNMAHGQGGSKGLSENIEGKLNVNQMNNSVLMKNSPIKTSLNLKKERKGKDFIWREFSFGNEKKK